jgi:molecular chaperone DnaK
VKYAASHADEYRNRRELVDARNEADALAYQVETTLNENRSKLPEADARRLEEAIAQVRQALAGEDVARIKRETEQLQHASHAMAQALYQQSQSAGQASGRPSSSTSGGPDVKEGEVVDAE